MDAPKSTVSRARSLRRRMTPPEVRLWVQLRGQALDGLKFRRQHPIGPYVLDFYCDSVRLAVEVDGQQHWLGAAQTHDAARDAWLLARGVRTLRIGAGLIFEDMDAAVRMIQHWASDRSMGTSQPPPPPSGVPLPHWGRRS